MGRSLDPPMPQGRCPALPARMENLPNPEGSLPGPPYQRHLQTFRAESLHAITSTPHKHSPHSKEGHGTCDEDSDGYSSKHRDKSCSDKGSKDKESNKSPWKCAASPLQILPSTTWVEKEPCIEVHSLAFCASSQSHQFSETDDQVSFICPTSISTPNKMESGPHANQLPATADVPQLPLR